MRIRFRCLIFGAAALAASRSGAQPLRAGSLSNADAFSITAPHTVIDLAHPATDTGNLTTATVIWNTGGSPCPAAMKIKVFRPEAYDTFAFIAERGPFAVSAGTVTVTLSPPIPVEQGDLIAVAQLQSATQCGGVRYSSEGGGFRSAMLSGDVSGAVTLGDHNATLFEESISAQASGQAEVYAGTILGAGSIHGASGSNFKTSVQLFNPGGAEIRGRLVFHPIGVAGSSNDPSVSYDLAPNGIAHYDDLVASIGTSGLGSVDVLTQSSPPPLVVTRIFNDAGAAGTAGFSEPFIHPGDPVILRSFPFDIVNFLGPTDVQEYRVNFGVRSFRQGLKIQVTVIASDGSYSNYVTHQYGAEEYQQLSAKDFTGIDVPAGAAIQVQVLDGTGVVYMVTVDNVTNDTAIQIGDRRQS